MFAFSTLETMQIQMLDANARYAAIHHFLYPAIIAKRKNKDIMKEKSALYGDYVLACPQTVKINICSFLKLGEGVSLDIYHLTVALYTGGWCFNFQTGYGFLYPETSPDYPNHGHLFMLCIVSVLYLFFPLLLPSQKVSKRMISVLHGTHFAIGLHLYYLQVCIGSVDGNICK